MSGAGIIPLKLKSILYYDEKVFFRIVDFSLPVCILSRECTGGGANDKDYGFARS
jgi:hypothetical protein